MWKGPGGDPGGGSKEGPPLNQPSSQAYTDLKEQYEQQQLLMAQLKEVIRKSEQPVTQEKVEEYANTLSKMNARAKKSKLKKATQQTSNVRTVDTPATEKINLLRQQLEENKVKLAERGKNQKGIEEMVTQLKAQLDDSQQLISLPTPSLNLSLTESKTEYSENTTSKELYNILLGKEKRLAELAQKVQKLEANVLDLHENLKEKDSVIDARTKAISLMTENLSKKGKSTLDSLDETREQMRKMQQDFVNMEAEMKARQLKLLDDLKQKNLEIAELQDVNNSLITEKNLLLEELSEKNETIEKYETELNRKSLENTDDGNKLQEEVAKLSCRIKELEELNASLAQKSPELSRSSPQRTGSKKNKRGQKAKPKFTEVASETVDDSKLKELQQLLDAQALENAENVKKLSDLQLIIDGLNDKLRVEEEHLESSESDEIVKLKKQLEESNKSMIKVKAQNKSKIKELNKQIDAFKKVSDVHAEVVKLEADKAKLNQKIAELEEEKGNLQLKLVESDSSKDSADVEHLKDLTDDLSLRIKDLEERDLTIRELENENQQSKKEVELLKDKLNTLSHLQNAQVTSEMTSIQFEEQFDKMEQEKKSLSDEKQTLLKEKDELLEKLEQLRKEKNELSVKLEGYMQENMDLMDKLEKLSAEKVSSAESIEIVEGLTQQEKLEIEQLQKNLDVATGNLKTSEENLDQEQNPDLNETVNQLTEETSELLQKIELFTVERREVMEKMEILSSENSQLAFKIKEIENNRDVLVETYEQLQTEKESLDCKLEEYKKENSNLKERLETDSKNTETVATKNETLVKLAALEKQHERLLEENDNLKKALKVKSESVQEKDCLEVEIKDAQNLIKDFESKLRTNVEEIQNYQDIIEENKTELISSLNLVQSLQSKLEEKEREVTHLNSVIVDLNAAIEKLELENKDNLNSSEAIESQLSELKSILNENLAQARDYEKELEQNSETIANLNKELKQMSNKILETEHLLSSKDDDIKKLLKERDNKEILIASLQEQIKQKDEAFHKLRNELSEKYLSLQKQMEESSGSMVPFQEKIDELQGKNKEQLEKMKKIAANLKKKTQAYQGLEAKLQEETEKWENEVKEKDSIISSLEETNVDLQNKLLALKSKEDNVATEISLKQEMSGSFHESVPETDLNDSLRSKVQELEMIKESQEVELIKYQERASKLEEIVASNEDARVNLEQQIRDLRSELQNKSRTFEEMSQSESILERSLAELKAHGEDSEKKLQEVLKESLEIKEQSKQIHNKNVKLKQKLLVAQEKVNELSNKANVIESLERTNGELNNRIAHLEGEYKHVQNEMISAANNHKIELERLDNDWQMQFNVVLKEKNELTVAAEKLDEQLKELIEKEAASSEELQEYKQRFEETNNELSRLRNEFNNNVLAAEELKSQINTLNNQTVEISKYRELSDELDSVKTRLSEAQIELENAKSELSNAHDEIANLSGKNLAQERVENVVIKAEVPTFQWGADQQDDPFAFISEQPVIASQGAFLGQGIPNASQGVPNISREISNVNQETTNASQEELLQKIKTLEFLLHNIEKEKEEAVAHCQELSRELTRLVYERESAPIGALEEQILQSPDDFDASASRKQLHDLEFTQTNALQKPIEEELVQSKNAYLCYNDQNQSVESQIVSGSDLIPTAEQQRQLQQIEYQQTFPYAGATQQPVSEPLSQTQNAYLCFKPQNIAIDAFGEDDDGWGFTPEEAKLEELAAHTQDMTAPLMQPLNVTIEELNQKIRVLEIEKENHLGEIKQLQVKSGKLIKKLKEMKARNEQLNVQTKAKSEGDFFNLDDTIQEELKSQIEKLEKQIKDVTNELHKEKSEKSALLKKIGVVSAANERMVEMKEKQDINMLTWQRQNQELKEKLQQYEWGDDGFGKPTDSPQKLVSKPTEGDVDGLKKQVAELTETLKDLMCDNEELQALLEEQRALRISAEKSKTTEPIAENMKTEREYLEILNERDGLQLELEQSCLEKKRLQDEVNSLIKRNDEQAVKMRQIEEETRELNGLIVEKNCALEQLQKEYASIQQSLGENQDNSNVIAQLNRQIEELLEDKMQVESDLQNSNQTIFEKNSFIGDLESKLHDLQLKHDNLMNSLQHTKTDESNKLQEYEGELHAIRGEKDELFKNLQEKTLQAAEIETALNEKILALKAELEQQTKRVQELLEDNTNKSSKIEELAGKEFEFAATIQQLNQEWEARVDQRGFDVAESWKLHLESRESEFSQVEQTLKREIAELEEKCNGLVNENNELRRNVDAEIRNEVDRIAALQKQINDRQYMLNEVSQKLDDKVAENNRIAEENQSCTVRMGELQVALQEKDAVITDHLNEIDRIRSELNTNQECLQNVIVQLQRKCAENLSNNYGLVSVELNRQIAEYEGEITGLKHALEEKRTLDLSSQEELMLRQEELQTVKMNFDELKSKFDKLQESYAALEKSLEERNSQVLVLTNEINNKQTVELSNSQQLEQNYEAVKAQLLESNGLVQNYKSEIEQKDFAINSLQVAIEENNRQLQTYSQLLEQKAVEVANVQAALSTKEDQLNYALENANLQTSAALSEQSQEINDLKKHIAETETSYEEILLQKDRAVEDVKLQLQELPAKIEECNSLRAVINEKEQRIGEMEAKIAEQETLINEDTKQLEELKSIIEEQVIKIEEQKKELFEKSKNYDSLIAEIDLRRQPLSQGANQNVSVPSASQGEEEDLSEPVRRAELDLALYMLHQRDVRCEELTVELTQLLEERDTLQLRLSNAIREKEEIRRKYDLDVSVTSEDSAGGSEAKFSPKSASKASKTSAIILGATQTELATDALEHSSEESDALATKLSELKSVIYKRDKTLVDEQDLRRLQQMSIMQQHRDVASRLPPEAAARLVDASYTLSRDVQSPSKVLLNWLWGRSTPKVNDI